MKKYLFFIVLIAFFSCSDNSKNQTPNLSIIELADSYYERVLEKIPELGYYLDVPLKRHDAVTSNKLSEIAKWERFEDSLYIELSKLDIAQILQKKDKITYWSLKEELEGSIGMRVCKENLWNVTYRGGWQSRWASIASFQPVGSEEFRAQAIDRWNKLPSFVETEIKNLKSGLAQGYSMPKVIVELVIAQLQVLQDYNIEDSPFMSPARRDEDQSFQNQWKELVVSKIIPAILKYQNFLKNDYLKEAREDVSMLAIPQGYKCYQANIRSETTTTQSGEDIYKMGQKIVAANKSKVSELGQELYQTNEFTEIIKLINEDSSNYFNTSEEVLEVNTRLLLKAKEESKKWFAVLPTSEVTIKPYEPHESGRGSYRAASGDKPAYFKINLSNPKSQKRGNNEKLTFHETYPGHHLQVGIERDLGGLHPISKLMGYTSYAEGWGRYSEQLAEEMGLYESKSALIGRRAWPSRGMVVDPGLHLMGWTKDEAIAFIMEAGRSEANALNIYHRIIIWPAQLTSYDVGGEEIKALRILAKKKLGDNFDIKEFHSKILENGSIPLSALRSTIYDWIDTKSN